ncbi:type II secretion system F family protein [Caldimonas brevitalea]|uniref:General secretion pathway protein F n=1 Tax=Caldimonas brevitalea TaxID=413882 RepID=A0A0G3BP05_9BURK|nr:type II secretion system F family protein [Caldimonas brevitalea]AKJ29723.1 general secretion pathway protein F [Caldimonas brevitalea]
MTRYAVKAVSASGEARHLYKEAACENEAALATLHDGLTPVSISPAGQGWMQRLGQPVVLRGRMRLPDIALFCEQMGVMAASGLTVEESLTVLSRQSQDRPAAGLARRLLPRIQAGMPLSDALQPEPHLPAYLPSMVRAAETGGRVGDGFAEAGKYLARQSATRSTLVNALTYPAVVMGTVLVAMVLVLTVVVPGFEPIFAGEEHRLPALTRAVLWLSAVVTQHGVGVSLLLLAWVLVPALLLRRSSRWRKRIVGTAARLRPVRLARQLDVARVLGVLGLLLRGGVEVSEAVALSAPAAASGALRDSLAACSRRLREGASISAALRAVVAIPEETRALIEVGEHTGELGATTMRAAQLLEADTSQQIERLVALANPLAIALLGLVVGLLVGGVMLGILSINQLALRP